jgi:hypothetical protein
VTTTPDISSALKSAVQNAVTQLGLAYPSIDLRVVPDAQGGAWIEMYAVPLGAPYQQSESFVVFLLPFNLPGSDIYPFFLRPDLSRTDGQGLGQGFQTTELAWPGDPGPRPVVQVSRRTRSAFAAQTAPQKVAKVLDWIRTQ